ncbi:MAG: hypothetical protein ACI910_001621 [Oleispira sp.]|jgi:hypothetical protein
MIKRSLIAASIAVVSVQQAAAKPLLPIDARGLAMGSTGVASAKLAHAPQYNPALLSTANKTDTFAIIFPQLGVVASDEDKLIESFDDIANEDYADDGSGNQESIIDHFDTVLTGLDDLLSKGPNSVEQKIKDLEEVLNDSSATTTDIRNASVNLDTSVGSVQVQTGDLTQTTFDLTSELDRVSGSPISASLGVNGAIAIPSKTFAAAVSVSGSAYFSGRLFFTEDDQNLLNDYAVAIDGYAGEVKDFTAATALLADFLDDADAACNPDPNTPQCEASGNKAEAQATVVDREKGEVDDFNRTSGSTVIIETDSEGNIVITEDPDLTSNVQVIGVSIAEIGITLSREFVIDGKNIAIGITPKLQTIKTVNYISNIEDDEIEDDKIKETEQNFSGFNLDIGAAYQFGPSKQWQAGIVVKNLLSKEYKTESNAYGTSGNEETSKTTISLDTQLRGGISHTTDWTVIAFDLDLKENAPTAFEQPTKYAAIGAELDLYDTFQLRIGYRKNLSVPDSAIASVGLGFSPFGIHLDIAAMANPNDPGKEAGAALELGFYF